MQEYPDYYEVIKKPIDLEKIGQKVRTSQYDNMEELLVDMVLMFDNACRYNEPDSQIYKVFPCICFTLVTEINDVFLIFIRTL